MKQDTHEPLLPPSLPSFFFSLKLIHLYLIKSPIKPDTLDVSYLPPYTQTVSQNH